MKSDVTMYLLVARHGFIDARSPYSDACGVVACTRAWLTRLVVCCNFVFRNMFAARYCSRTSAPVVFEWLAHEK